MSTCAVHSERTRRTVRHTERLTVFAACLLSTLVPRMDAHARDRGREAIAYVLQGQATTELRVFDPVTRRDEGVCTFQASASAFYWDPAGTMVRFIHAGRLQRIEWSLGARPWPFLDLPRGQIYDWWFNPDSQYWQVASGGGVAPALVRDGQRVWRCYHDLWQSSDDGLQWSLARSETTDCSGSHYPGWLMRDRASIPRAPAIGLHSSFESMRVGAGGIEPASAPAPDGEALSAYEWFSVSLAASGRYSLRLRGLFSSDSLRRFWTFYEPIYLVDRERRTQRMLETGGQRNRMFFRLHAGVRGRHLLLVAGNALVFDLVTGARVGRLPVTTALAWVPAPHRLTPDHVGQRRLRAFLRW